MVVGDCLSMANQFLGMVNNSPTSVPFICKLTNTEPPHPHLHRAFTIQGNIPCPRHTKQLEIALMSQSPQKLSQPASLPHPPCFAFPTDHNKGACPRFPLPFYLRLTLMLPSMASLAWHAPSSWGCLMICWPHQTGTIINSTFFKTHWLWEASTRQMTTARELEGRKEGKRKRKREIGSKRRGREKL